VAPSAPASFGLLISVVVIVHFMHAFRFYYLRRCTQYRK
jgi:hypothetical protein